MALILSELNLWKMRSPEIGFAKTSQKVFPVLKGWTYVLTNAVKLSIQPVRSIYKKEGTTRIWTRINCWNVEISAKLKNTIHNAGELTVEVLDLKHNIETLSDRLTSLQDCL